MTPSELLEAAAAKLEAATSLDEVKSAHRQVRSAVRAKRREGSVMAQTAEIMFDLWTDQAVQGVPLDERVSVFEKSLRAALHWQRAEPWHFLCDSCDDTGWMFGTCTPKTPCGRPFRLPGAASDDYTGRGRCSPNHSFCRPCPECVKGRGFHAGMTQRRETSEGTLAAVGKSKKSGFSRIGG